jgi:hypothetical protein
MNFYNYKIPAIPRSNKIKQYTDNGDGYNQNKIITSSNIGNYLNNNNQSDNGIDGIISADDDTNSTIVNYGEIVDTYTDPNTGNKYNNAILLHRKSFKVDVTGTGNVVSDIQVKTDGNIGLNITKSNSGGGGINYVTTGSGLYVTDMDYNSTTNTLTETKGNPAFYYAQPNATIANGEYVPVSFEYTNQFQVWMKKLQCFDFIPNDTINVGGASWNPCTFDNVGHGYRSTLVMQSADPNYSGALLFNTTKIMAFDRISFAMDNLYLNPNGGQYAVDNYVYISPNGDINYTGSIYGNSDERIKENIKQIEETNILNLNPVEFNYINSNEKHIGLIAQEVEEIIPEIVKTETSKNAIRIDKNGEEINDIKTINYIELIPLLIKQIQIQSNQINELKIELNNIKNKLN